MIPDTLKRLLDATPEPLVCGISGSRKPDDLTLRAVDDLLAYLSVRPGKAARILVGDARGVDSVIGLRWPRSHTRVFYRSQSSASGVGALIERSKAMVHGLVAEQANGTRPWLIAFPAKACPITIFPHTSWLSGQTTDGRPAVSGTWSTVAYALGRGIRTIVYLPPPFSPPVHRHWRLNTLGDGYFWEDR